MITTLIGVQTVCMGVSAFYAYKLSKRTVKLKKVKQYENGHKHYRVGGY